MIKRLSIGSKTYNYTHPERPRYAALGAHHPQETFSGFLKVITYNIQLSKKIDKALALLSSHSDLRSPDIICLQEMDHNGVQLIAERLKLNYVYYPAILHPRSGKDFGNAVLSKWPVIADQKIIFPKLGAGNLQRIAVYATILAGKTEIAVISLHLKMFAKRDHRRAAIDQIIAAVDPSVRHCIVAGDFNTFTKAGCQAVLDPLRKADFGLLTESVGATYQYWYLLNKKASLDHIFVKGMRVVHAGKVIDRKPSDHIPVWGELKVHSGQ